MAAWALSAPFGTAPYDPWFRKVRAGSRDQCWSAARAVGKTRFGEGVPPAACPPVEDRVRFRLGFVITALCSAGRNAAAVDGSAVVVDTEKPIGTSDRSGRSFARQSGGRPSVAGAG